MIHTPVFQNPHLDGRTFSLPGEQPGVLLLHGFTATTVEVRALAEFLNQRGLAVAAPLLPGHGTKPQDMLSMSWKNWAAAAENAFLELSQVHGEIVVGGESLGGLLSLYLARRNPQIKKIVLFAPALQRKGLWKAAVVSPFVKLRPKGYGGTDPDGHLPWQGYTVIPLPAVNELRKIQRFVRNQLCEIHQPILIFQGRLDKTIDPLSSKVIFDRIGSKDKELIWLENSGHCVILDVEREIVFHKTFDFIREGSK